MVSDDGCPAAIAVCLDGRNARTLERNVRALVAYSREAWIRCGPAAPPENDGPSIRGAR
jgi:hypothetical protein